MAVKTRVRDIGRGNLEFLARAYGEKAGEIAEAVAERCAQLARDTVLTGGRATGQTWKPLAESTVNIFGGDPTHPLIRTGDLVTSIDVEKVSKTQFRVKVSHPGATTHEFGSHLKVTDKMRGYLSARGFHIKTQTLTIPERPFMRPAADMTEREIPRIARRVLDRPEFKVPIRVGRL